MSDAHFVLVHGAFHRAWHLELLAQNLAEAGHGVSTLDLPSVASDPGKVPGDGALRADVEAIKAIMEEAASKSDRIIPVFHSYSGIPGGEAAVELDEETKKKVQRLVYLCAFVLEQGTALTTRSAGQVAPWARIKDHTVVVPDPLPVFYHDVEPKLAEEAAKRVISSSYASFVEKTQHTPWKTLPCTYIFCTKDRALPFEAQQAMLAGVGEEDRANWETVTMEGGHSPFLAQPDECAKVLGNIAGEVVA